MYIHVMGLVSQNIWLVVTKNGKKENIYKDLYALLCGETNSIPSEPQLKQSCTHSLV